MKPRTLWTATLLLVAIGVTAVLRRLTHLLSPAPDPTGLDAGFARHSVLTAIHILPGLLFVLLGPLQFVRTLRTRHPAVHRWTGRLFLIAGLITGMSALAMSAQMSIGGPTETTATTLFGVFFLFSLVRAYAEARNRRFALHREWMIRAFAIGLAVAFVRPIVGIFFATSRLTHLTPHDFFGIAFWLGFTIQTLAAEMWIRHTRSAPYRPNVSQL